MNPFARKKQLLSALKDIKDDNNPVTCKGCGEKYGERKLREILPRRFWIPINDLLVRYGQKVCTPVSPFCCDSNCFVVKNIEYSPRNVKAEFYGRLSSGPCGFLLTS